MHRVAKAELEKLGEYMAAVRDCLIDAEVANLRGRAACRPSKVAAHLRRTAKLHNDQTCHEAARCGGSQYDGGPDRTPTKPVHKEVY